jgi:hypothetical protein
MHRAPELHVIWTCFVLVRLLGCCVLIFHLDHRNCTLVDSLEGAVVREEVAAAAVRFGMCLKLVALFRCTDQMSVATLYRNSLVN